ncbi:MAG: hypothetical protein VKK62_10775 [Synechococcaceae cyanobacterium]|nr:hypothetical protein [Synechococcaceae cyanobacterium]
MAALFPKTDHQAYPSAIRFDAVLAALSRSPRVQALAAGVILAAAFSHPQAAQAVSTPGTDPTAAIQAFANLTANASLSNTTYGYEFTTRGSIAIRSLGIYDTGANGLAEAHDVGIWSVGNATPLASIQIPAGTTATLVNNFRYQNLANLLTLQAGTYRIGAFYSQASNDTFVENIGGAGSATTAPNLSLGKSFYSFPASASLAYPNLQTAVDPGYIGPNFQYSEVPGPLPLLGAATAFGYSRRLRQRLRRRSSAD